MTTEGPIIRLTERGRELAKARKAEIRKARKAERDEVRQRGLDRLRAKKERPRKKIVIDWKAIFEARESAPREPEPDVVECRLCGEARPWWRVRSRDAQRVCDTCAPVRYWPPHLSLGDVENIAIADGVIRLLGGKHA